MTPEFQDFPAEISEDELLSSLYSDLQTTFEMALMVAGTSREAPRVMRVLLVGLARAFGVRERRDLKRLCRLSTTVNLKQHFAANEWQELPGSADSLANALGVEDENLLRRVATLLLQDRYVPMCKHTAKALKTWEDIPLPTKSVAQDRPSTAEPLLDRHVMIPTLLAPTYQFAIGTRKPNGIIPHRNGRFAVVFPGTTRQMDFFSKDENYLTTLQKYVNGTLGNPLTSKIVVGSLYFHQRHVQEGGLPNDIVVIQVERMAKLVGGSAIKSNRSVNDDFKRLYSRTFFVLSTARAVWIPERFGVSAQYDWIRSPLYHVEYEGGHGNPYDLEDPGTVTGYRLGDVFQAAVYGNGRIARQVAPLNFAQYFAWNSKHQGDEQCLHLFYTQMFQTNWNLGGTYRATIGSILEDAGLNPMEGKRAGERYERFLDAHTVLAREKIIKPNWRVEADASAPLHEKVIQVEPSEELMQRIRAVVKYPNERLLLN